MERFMRFLSPKRFWHNAWTHFPVPMWLCLILGSSFFVVDIILESNLYYGLIIALTFSTAASCICRRFGVHRMLVWMMTAAGLILGCIFGQGSVTYWLQMISVGVCVIVSCWTRRFYLQMLFVPAWFSLCLGATIILFFLTIWASFLIIYVPFGFAPFIFLGGLPFGDEDFTSPEQTKGDPS